MSPWACPSKANCAEPRCMPCPKGIGGGLGARIEARPLATSPWSFEFVSDIDVVSEASMTCLDSDAASHNTTAKHIRQPLNTTLTSPACPSRVEHGIFRSCPDHLPRWVVLVPTKLCPKTMGARIQFVAQGRHKKTCVASESGGALLCCVSSDHPQRPMNWDACAPLLVHRYFKPTKAKLALCRVLLNAGTVDDVIQPVQRMLSVASS